MDFAGEELARIVRYANHHLSFVDWNKEKRASLRASQEGRLDSDLSSSFYFLDKHGQNEHGDTAFHRLLSMHIPYTTVKSFVKMLSMHQNLLKAQPRTEGNNDEFRNLCAVQPSPPSIFHQNKQGVSALHVAVYRNSWDVENIVRLLLGARDYGMVAGNSEFASLPMECGSCPLHIMCGQNLTIKDGALLALIEAAPHIASKEDENGDNPLSLLWKNVLRFSWAVSIEQGRADVELIDGGLAWMTIITPHQYIKYSRLLIKASRNQVDWDRAISIHELCSVPRCPPLLLRLAIDEKYNKKFDVQGSVYSTDENGMLPLHHAARTSVVSYQNVPSHFGESGPKSLLEILIDEYPESVAHQDNYGRLPLHYALENRFIDEEALLLLVRSYPESLRVQDPISGLYPFMIVASNLGNLQGSRDITSGCNSSHGLDTVGLSYFLLLSCPEAVQFPGERVYVANNA